MATTIHDPKVGDFAYPNGTPQQAFKITKIVDPKKYWPTVEGVNKKGEVITYHGPLQSFIALIEDHEKKVTNHRKLLEILKGAVV